MEQKKTIRSKKNADAQEKDLNTGNHHEMLGFEQAFSALKEQVERVEAKDAPLDDAIDAYEKGMAYYDQCLKILNQAEQRIKMVNPSNGNVMPYSDKESI